MAAKETRVLKSSRLGTRVKDGVVALQSAGWVDHLSTDDAILFLELLRAEVEQHLKFIRAEEQRHG